MVSAESYKRNYVFVVFLMFSFGVVMTMLYLPLIESFLHGKENLPLGMIAILILINGFLTASVNGIIVIPCLDILLGCAVALQVDKLRESFFSNEAFGLDLTMLCILLPTIFVISAWGMSTSAQIRTALASNRIDCKKICTFTYFIILVGLAFSVAVQAMMFI